MLHPRPNGKRTMTATRKPTGLGKRKTPDTPGEGLQEQPEGEKMEEIDPQVYFPVEDDQDELQQIQVMFANAEEFIDDPYKATILFRAVAHECDRLGRQRDELDETKGGCGDQSTSEDPADCRKAPSLNASFYRIFGDSLYHLAFLETAGEEGGASDDEDRAEDEEKAKERIQLLAAAIERYQNGLELFRGSHELFSSLQRALLLRSILAPEREERLEDTLQSIATIVRSSSASLEDSGFFIAAVELASTFGGLSQCQTVTSTIEELLTSVVEQNPRQKLMLLSVLLLRIDDAFDRDEINVACGLLEKADTLVASLAGSQLDEASERHFLKLSAQHHIWKGCVSEAQSDDTAVAASEANVFYNQAVDTWRRISDKYAIPIPKHILELETRP